MKNATGIFKLLSDESRLRLLAILERKELCVCQLMGVLRMSQPLVSRNLSLLSRAGFLSGRKEGKLMFYSINRMLNKENALALVLLRELLKKDRQLEKDLSSLKDCEEFQKRSGKCGMETFKAFMEYQKKKKRGAK